MDKFFQSIRETQKDMKQRGLESRMMADPGVTPEVGRFYTVSPCFKFGDRSWIDDIWKVVATSGPNVLVEIIDPDKWPETQLRRMFNAEERAWYPAEAIVSALGGA